MNEHSPEKIEKFPEKFDDKEQKLQDFKSLALELYESCDYSDSLMADLAEAGAKHKEWYSYIFWHILISSTPPADIIEFDTPEHDIKNFLNDLKNKYSKTSD